MAEKSGLTPSQQRFVDEYLIDLNATQAAVRAGYSAKTASQQGSRLLRQAKVAAAIKAGQAVLAAKTGITAERVLEGYAAIAFAGMSKFMRISPEGDPIIDLSRCTPTDLDLLAEVTSEDFVDGRGEDARSVRRIRLKPLDRIRALDALARHIGLTPERLDVGPSDAFRSMIEAIQRRGSKAPIARDVDG